MTSRYLPPGALVEDPAFRRVLVWSAALHVLFAFGGLTLPGLTRAPLLSAPVFVDLVAAPKPAAAPKPRRQVIDEPVVIPKKSKPKPKPKPKAKPKPKPKPEAKPKAPPLSAEELLAQLRQRVEARTAASGATPAASAKAAGRGKFDPEMAAYQRKLKSMLYANWAGAAAFGRRHDLVVSFKVLLDPGGGVRSVSLVASSGDRHFDESAERAIWKTIPFPPPPRGSLELDVRFDPKESL